MRIVCQREALLRGVAVAANVAPARGPKPILSGVLLTAHKTAVEAVATDLEIAIRSRVSEVIVEQEGEVVLNGQMIVDILRSIESKEVTIARDGRFCEITAQDASYKLVTDDPTEFPEVRAPEGEGVAVPRSFVEELFQRTAFAAARDVGRYAINGILVELGEGRLRFVATDGRRLAVATRDLPDAKDRAKVRAIVPVKGVQECLRGSEGSSTVRIHLDDQRVIFMSEDVDVAAKPVEGEFPEYSGVIPKDNGGTVFVERDALLAAVRKVSMMTSDESSTSAIHIRVSKDEIAVSSRLEGRGEARTRLDAECESDPNLEVEFNPDFILDYLKPLPAQKIAYCFRDAASAALFRLGDGEDIYVLMPITAS